MLRNFSPETGVGETGECLINDAGLDGAARLTGDGDAFLIPADDAVLAS